MLVLSRRVSERIVIGDNIEVVVVSVDRGKVRLGIKAPKEVAVFRRELLSASPESKIQDDSANASGNSSKETKP